MQEILSAVDAELFGVWFLIGAALVFWMQAGFAMVETGFTRAKNSGNIIMKVRIYLVLLESLVLISSQLTKILIFLVSYLT